jgi:hypothetical protein
MSTPKRPSPDDLILAAMWLDSYEGEDDAAACHRVAAWLRHQAEAAEFRHTCKEAGVSVADARAAIAKATGA